MMQHRFVTWGAVTLVAVTLGGLLPAAAPAAQRRNSITAVLHPTAAAGNASGEVEENIENNPAATIACCLANPGEQGCNDLRSADCTAAGGRDLGPGSTCDMPQGGQDPCGDFQGCTNEPDGSNELRGLLRGRLTVKVRRLAPRAKFRVFVGDVRIGTLKTSAAGRGRKRFRGRKLTVDPRGKRIVVANAGGTAVLTGVTSDPTTPCGVACCLNMPGQQGCADLAAADCAAVGGIDAGTGSCNVDPCVSSVSGAFLDGVDPLLP